MQTCNPEASHDLKIKLGFLHWDERKEYKYKLGKVYRDWKRKIKERFICIIKLTCFVCTSERKRSKGWLGSFNEVMLFCEITIILLKRKPFYGKTMLKLSNNRIRITAL